MLTVLEDLGLTKNEAEIYLASLSLGATTILQLAKASQIRRTTVYSVIESLKKKGLIYIEPKGFKQLYVAEHPDKLETVLDNKKIALSKLLPQFTALHNLKGKESTIKYYEGLPAIKTIYENVLKPLQPNDFYLVIGDLQKFFDLDRPYFDNFIKKRIKGAPLARIISTDSKQARYQKEYGKNFNNEVRILPPGTSLSVDTMIVPQRVTIFNLDEPLSAVSLENEAMIQMHRQLFEILWASLPE